MPLTTRALRSTITDDGVMTLGLDEIVLEDPTDDEVVVRVEATPINPSDLVLMVGPADVDTLESSGDGGLRLRVPLERLGAVRGRIGHALRAGGEGAGVVVAAGRNLKALEGRRVGGMGPGFFADHVTLKGRHVALLPDGAEARDGAAMFINPLTALGLVETARRDGHRALVHTAAGSNLGGMLERICRADGLPLVNIVRSSSAEAQLRARGASYVLNSNAATFAADLAGAIEATGATAAFDPIGGGTLGSDVLATMERLAVGRMSDYDRYGSAELKQLYLYGALDKSPTVLEQLRFGLRWSVSGWLLFHFLERTEPAVVERLKRRVVDELYTTFASPFDKVVGLAEALSPEAFLAYERKATGSKMLIDPRL